VIEVTDGCFPLKEDSQATGDLTFFPRVPRTGPRYETRLYNSTVSQVWSDSRIAVPIRSRAQGR